MAARLSRLVALLPFMLLAACGGGGGGTSADSGGAQGGATVGVLVTDAPVGKWDEAIATITEVRLIGGPDGQEVLFSGSETLDLLKLADFSELFTVAEDVPAGGYSKIRLQLADLVLNDRDAAGNLVESIRPQLVGNGKVDLNPRAPFRLEPGDVVVIELDFDMEKSLKITETGNGKLIVRPVIFVDIRTERPQLARLTRIHGEITALDAAAGALRLCQTAFAGDWDRDPEALAATLDDDVERRCITVLTDGGTGIFSGDGEPQEFADLAVGERATAIGRLRPLDDDESDGDADDDEDADPDHHHPFALEAFVIEEGPLGTFRRIRGTVAETVDPATDRFGLALAPGQGISSDAPLPVQLYEKSRIFNRAGDELGREDILVDRAALVDGVLVLGDTDLLRSPLVILGDVDAPQPATLQGTVVSVDEDALELRVNDGTADRCVDASTAEIFLVDDSDGFSSSRGSLADLSPGQPVAVFGAEGLGGCLVANTILADQD